jgi:hypothetical protein
VTLSIGPLARPVFFVFPVNLSIQRGIYAYPRFVVIAAQPVDGGGTSRE